MNAMCGVATRSVAAQAFEHIRQDPQIEVVPRSADLSLSAIELYTARRDKEWSLTDCLSFVGMERRKIRDALTADSNFEQAGFRSVLINRPPE
jgi:predicted nucleic acid-binding protein